jgi:hypothetical protein
MAVITSYLIDLSGIVTTIKKLIWWFIFKNKKPFQNFNFKPFDCSLCMTHHILLLYLIITGHFTMYCYLVVCLLSFFSSNITSFLIQIKDLFIKIENNIFN